MRFLTRLRPVTASTDGRLPSRRVAWLLLDVAFAYALLWASHTLYRTSTGVVQLCDSAYSLAVAERWLTAGTLDMTATIPADPAKRQAMPGYLPGHDMP